MKMHQLIAPMALTALCFCTAAFAEMYQWTDKNGTHYGDRPPAGAKNVKPLELPPTNTAVPVPAIPRYDPPANNAPAAPEQSMPPSDAECDGKLAEADSYEKSDRGDLARPIYDWMVTHCPQNRGPNIRARRLLTPTQSEQPDQSEE